MERSIIVVLEDMRVRVDWLRESFPEAKIVWSETVADFISSFAGLDQSRIAVILLDHDIGGPFYGSSDDEGKNGLDAARELMGVQDVPVIIWSINGDGSRAMQQELEGKGHTVAWIPFLKYNMRKLELAIASQMQ